MSNTKKKRVFNESFVSFGFTSIVHKGVETPQCLICNKVLSVESMKPSKLKQHLHSIHLNFADKGRSFFSRKEKGVKRQWLDSEGSFYRANEAGVEASFRLSYQIAKQNRPHTIGEELIMPCAETLVKLMIGEKYVDKLNPVSLSDNTVQRRIAAIIKC